MSRRSPGPARRWPQSAPCRLGAPRRARRGDARRRRRQRRLRLRRRRRRRRDRCSDNDANERRIPASNQKLFTTAAFLAELGADGRTCRPAPTPTGKLTGAGDSVLDGDLVIVGDGDPAFGTARFARAQRPAGDPGLEPRPQRRPGRGQADHRPGARRRHDLRPRAPRRPRPEPALGPLVQQRLRRRRLRPRPGAGRGDGAEGGAAKARRRGRGPVGRANLPDAELDDEPLADVASPRGRGADRGDQRALEQLLRRDAAQAARRRRAASAAPGAAATTRSSAFANSVGTDVQAVDGSGLSRTNSRLARRRSASC